MGEKQNKTKQKKPRVGQMEMLMFSNLSSFSCCRKVFEGLKLGQKREREREREREKKMKFE